MSDATGRRNRLKGVLLIAGGTLCIATVPVFSKVLLEDLSSVHFSFFWMCGALAFTLLYSLVRGPLHAIASVRREWRSMLLTGVWATLWVFFAFEGIKRIDPTVSAILFNSKGVWGLLIGLIVFHERYRTSQYVGMSIIIGGLCLNFIETGGVDEVIGSMFTLIAALSSVLASMQIKRFVARSGIAPALIARFLVPLLVMLVLGAKSGIPFHVLHGQTLVLFLIGSFVGPFLSFVLIYESLKYLELAVHSFAQSTSLFFTALYSWVVFATAPSAVSIAAGVVVITGMVIISLGRRRSTSGSAQSHSDLAHENQSEAAPNNRSGPMDSVTRLP